MASIRQQEVQEVRDNNNII